MIILYAILCIACLCLGYYAGYKVKPKEKILIKKKPDAKKIRESQEIDEEAKKYMDRYSTILDNINNYDGSSNNQRKVS